LRLSDSTASGIQCQLTIFELISWIDPSEVARILIDVHGNTGFPRFGPWYTIVHGWTGIPLELARTVCHCSGLRKCVFMVWSSNMARTSTCVMA